MKLQRAVVLLLSLSLAACSGGPIQRQDPGVDPMLKAYKAVMENYVDAPDPATLLQSAYMGARRVLTDQGIAVADLQPPAWTQGEQENWQRFLQAYAQITDRYAKQVGSNRLEYAAISAMAESLKDCQTHFFDPPAVAERQAEVNDQQPQFGGIGVILKNIPGHPTLLRVLDGPARAAGLRPGDEIVSIDGKPVAGQTFEQVRNSIRGPQGTQVQVTVRRPGQNGPMSFDVSRAQIQAPVFDAGILGSGEPVGYLHIYSFPAGIPEQLDNALSVFDERGVQSIVLDVRANTGGEQQNILAALGRFINGGTVEIQTDRSGKQTPLQVDPSLYWKHPKTLVVLADEDTQSGGEIFAKAMQEEGGYRLIGAPTAGCTGTGRAYDLGDGSRIEVTTAKVVSGNGADINRVGVQPDQQVAYPMEDLAAGRDPQLGAALGALGIVPGRSSGASPAPSGQGSPDANQGSPLVKPLGGPTPAGSGVPIIK